MAQQRSSKAAKAIRSHLRGKTGRSFWRSLDELAGTDDFRAFLEAEFPSLAPARGGVDRRALLKAMGASLALAGLAGCDAAPDEAALPYVNAPESTTPGVANWYATAVTMAGYAQPALGKTYSGRPVKLEGNPDHPATRGATDIFLQAALLGLYDPDRSQAPRYLGRSTSWGAFDTAMTARAGEITARQGEGFRLLTGRVTSPTLRRQIDELMRRWPKARWHAFEPIGEEGAAEAARLVSGAPLDRHLHLENAEAVVCLDADPLGPGPRQAIHARRWSTRRLAHQGGDGECRLFVAEPTPSITGAMAGDRLIAVPARIALLARAVAAGLGIAEGSRPALPDHEAAWVKAATAALNAHRGRGLLSIGAHVAPDVQALGLLINERIGSFGATLRFTEAIAAIPPDGARSLQVLAEDMAAGHVTTLVMLGVNPAYSAPADLGFRDALGKVAFAVHAGDHNDETAALSHWHLPLQHELESWSDARATDGTVSIIQPLVRPFYDVRSVHTVLEKIAGRSTKDRDIVEATWRAAWGDAFAERWRDALLKGYVPDSAPPFATPSVTNRAIAVTTGAQAEGLTVAFRPDATIWDGRFANNGWLQELPKPLDKITWDNVIRISPQLAKDRSLTNGDEVRLDIGGRSVVGPVWIAPGQEPDTLTVSLGYGRKRGGRLAEGLGYDAYAIRQVEQPAYVAGVVLTATNERRTIATTQAHQAMDGYDFVRTVALGETVTAKPSTSLPTFYPKPDATGPSWGMSIDLDLCIGCNACVVACMAENNVPVVGKELVAQGREMHWLRVDRYYEGDPAAPKSYFQPVPCMHCEQAPCEMGCPVNAAVHSSDGLNLQVYNRCIGTRTCSSYCPYKVRRFNWFDYTGKDPEPVRAMRNPEVTVRDRGVMEKCTYCVQRITEARIAAKKEGRPIRDGEVVTACQQACPTQAIVFGDVTDPKTQVSRRKASGRDYNLLEEANTRPRTTYLARIDTGEGGTG
jgi:molybdopterin-containing oxidoreductase family iron-sulfur binding subunit